MITQSQIATRLGISDARLSQILSGDNPGHKTAKAMADLTGIDWYFFIDMDRSKMRSVLEKAIEAQKS